MPQTHKQKIGKIGEDVACKFLARSGFIVLERNYWKKWGELDIIIERDDTVHFVEVKTISSISDKHIIDDYRPEDNIHSWKLKRLSRTIQTYLLEKGISSKDKGWQFDIVIIFLDQKLKKARVRFLENIII